VEREKETALNLILKFDFLANLVGNSGASGGPVRTSRRDSADTQTRLKNTLGFPKNLAQVHAKATPAISILTSIPLHHAADAIVFPRLWHIRGEQPRHRLLNHGLCDLLTYRADERSCGELYSLRHSQDARRRDIVRQPNMPPRRGWAPGDLLCSLDAEKRMDTLGAPGSDLATRPKCDATPRPTSLRRENRPSQTRIGAALYPLVKRIQKCC